MIINYVNTVAIVKNIDKISTKNLSLLLLHNYFLCNKNLLIPLVYRDHKVKLSRKTIPLSKNTSNLTRRNRKLTNNDYTVFDFQINNFTPLCSRLVLGNQYQQLKQLGSL